MDWWSGKPKKAAGSRKRGVERGRTVRGTREAPAGGDDAMQGALRARRGEAYERGRLRRDGDGRKGRARERGSQAPKADGGGRRVRAGYGNGQRGAHRGGHCEGVARRCGRSWAPGRSGSGARNASSGFTRFFFVQGRRDVLGTEGAGRRALDGASGLLLREALLFGMDVRAAREGFCGGGIAVRQASAAGRPIPSFWGQQNSYVRRSTSSSTSRPRRSRLSG